MIATKLSNESPAEPPHASNWPAIRDRCARREGKDCRCLVLVENRISQQQIVSRETARRA